MKNLLDSGTKENELVQYGLTDLKISQLREKFLEVPNASKKEGYKALKNGLSELRPYRIGVEKKRKELKSESLAWGRRVDSEAKRITAEIISIEQPYKDAKEAYDKAEAEAEQIKINKQKARIADIKERISYIRSLENGLISAGTDEINKRLALAIDLVISRENYGEFLEEAEKVFCEIRENLEDALTERLRAEKQQAEQEESQRLLDERKKELDAQQAVIDKANAKKDKEERDAKIADQAAETASLKANQEAQAELDAAARRESDLKARAKEELEESKIREDHLEALAINADVDAKAQAQRLIDEAEAKNQRDKEKADERENDKNNRAKINRQAVNALVDGGLDEADAKTAVTIIAQRKVPNVVISY